MTTPSRTRLSPEDRKKQLLGTAKQMIATNGLQSFTMEGLARTAMVSSPLVYNYFPTRKTFLQELLAQEFEIYSTTLEKNCANVDNFTELMRVFICCDLDHHASGNILPHLQSQPDLTCAIESSQNEHTKKIVRLLVHSTAENFKLTEYQAALVAKMSSGASRAAADFFAGSDVDREKVIDLTWSYMFAGIEKIASMQHLP